MWFCFAIYKNAVLFFCTLALSAAATVANIKIHYDAKTPQFAIFGTRVICVFYSNNMTEEMNGNSFIVSLGEEGDVVSIDYFFSAY